MPEIRARKNIKDIARSVLYVVRVMPVSGQRLGKHIPATTVTQPTIR
jgi:hypothetical protein